VKNTSAPPPLGDGIENPQIDDVKSAPQTRSWDRLASRQNAAKASIAKGTKASCPSRASGGMKAIEADS
jgi:hypothetical protein